MLEFMLIGMPRSGTTWASNWLTTDKTLCLHDPLWSHHYKDWDSIKSKNGKRMGVACTGIGFWPDFVNRHPARKVILHRELREVDDSLRYAGCMRWDQPMQLDKLKGLHVNWMELFHRPERIWDHLLPDIEFDEERWELLRQIKMVPEEKHIHLDAPLQKVLMSEISQKPVAHSLSEDVCLGV